MKKISVRIIFTIFILLIGIPSEAQNRAKSLPGLLSYELTPGGDTINRVDAQNHRQGRWVSYHPERYGDEAFYEIGYFLNNDKIGAWRAFTKDGVLMKEENYKNGRKHGEAKYYEQGHLICVGNYLALNARYKYDTIMVEDPDTELWKPVIIESRFGSVKHGFWTFYKPPSLEIEKIVEYQADEIIYENEYLTKDDSVYLEKRIQHYPHNANGQLPTNTWVLPQDKGKKPIRYTDFPENTKYVKPNPGRKGR